MSAHRLGVGETVAVTLALLLALAPHMLRFPLLLSLACVAAGAWRVLGAQGRLPLPDREHRALWLAKQFLAVAAFVSIYIAYHGRVGREAGVELLAALLGLKLLEMRAERDYYVVTFLCYFLVVTNFFFSQTMATALYMLGVVVLVTAVLVQFNTPPAWRRPLPMLRFAALMTAQSMPLMLLAFVLFPRIPGPLWGLPQDAYDAVTGLSEDMQIGRIARLALSDEIAFRVEFEGAAPRGRDLYWRGPVLWVTDGRDWHIGASGYGTPGPIAADGPTFRYTVTLEPHRKRWLLGLDRVLTAPPGAHREGDQRLLAAKPVTRRERYELSSAPRYRDLHLDAEARAAALRVPVKAHPRTRALAAAWALEGTTTDAALVVRALDYIRQQGFTYSLTPPPLKGDAIDSFLFETRSGFCEHFAAAFVVLMRVAGVPARVVTGYQGGEFNRFGDYMVVRQRDAHAWAEVYLAGRGWVRVDPTGAVAPERLSLGSAEALPGSATTTVFERGDFAFDLWSGARDAIDAFAYGWNRWVLGYTPAQQRRLLDELGLEDWDYGTLVIVLTLALAVVTGGLALVLARGDGERDPLKSAYARFCTRLARAGVAREPSEAPLAFARRAMRLRADLAGDIVAITRLYTELRYGRARAGGIAELQRRVAAFRPARRR